MAISAVGAGYGDYSSILGAKSPQPSRQAGPANLLEAVTARNEQGDTFELSAEGDWFADAAENGSPAGQLAAQRLFGQASLDGVIQMEELTALQQETQSSVESRLRSLFAEHGIDTSQEIRLEVASDGRLIVAGDHPQKAQIEELVNADASLRNDFVKLASLTSILAAAQEAAPFHEAYANDPYAAVAQYSYLFDSTSKASVCLSIQGDRCQAVYERPGYTSIALGGEEG